MPTLSTRTPTSVMLITGEYFDHTRPDPAVLNLDVLEAGMRQCRFNGQTTRLITVAEHSIRVRDLAVWLQHADAEIVSFVDLLRLGLHALLHDAHETILPWGDCLRPGKTPEMRTVEAATDRVIWQALGLDPPTERMTRIIKAADDIALFCEASRWQPGSHDWVAWPDLPEHWPSREWLINVVWQSIGTDEQAWRRHVEAAMGRLAAVLAGNAVGSAEVGGA